MTERDPDRLADELEHQADDLQERSERLEDQVRQARQEWERKRADQSVPGAVPPEGSGPPKDQLEDDGES